MNLTNQMTEMTTEVIKIIQKETATFVGKQKVSYDGVEDDLVTTADIAAQAYFQAEIERNFPEEGIVGEENLNKESANGRYFTIDPLDGTKAFGRKQSTGVGTMIAHVDENGNVDAVCVGDVNTGELYYYGPDAAPTRRRFGVETPLPSSEEKEVENMFVILRDHPENYPAIIQDLIRKERRGIFKGVHVESGSIGINIARLWKGEVGMIVPDLAFITPWDTTPVIGMNKALGIVHIEINSETLVTKTVELSVPKDIYKSTSFQLLVRKDFVPEILAWIEDWKKAH